MAVEKFGKGQMLQKSLKITDLVKYLNNFCKNEEQFLSILFI